MAQVNHGSSSTGARIGILTGSGPEAGMYQWQCLLDARRRLNDDNFRGDRDMPYIKIISDPRLGFSGLTENHNDMTWKVLEEDIHQLGNQVDYFIIACYSLHRYASQILSMGMEAKFVSLETAIDSYMAQHRPKRTTILRPELSETEKETVFCNIHRYTFIDPVLEPERVRKLIQSVKLYGSNLPENTETLNDILTSIHSDAIVLGCTELPLICSQQHHNPRIVDGMRLTAEQLISTIALNNT
ncbi:MAG: aspartate/glutamate racemase family protein [Magnetococcales bacterium]|nr:aspartate/glutamate racemase family protein [Magnetococcales bacterium]